jgi:Zn-dependent protease with chaperone function
LCEVADHDACDALLLELGVRDRGVVVWQRRWRMAILATILCVFAAFSAYRWGVPLAADAAARFVPVSWALQSDRQVLAMLDRSWLEPSTLPQARKDALRAQFAALGQPAGEPGIWTLDFRAAPQVGANAFALPGGTIVMTDELVRLAGSDQEILAVLAHELGHVRHRHGLRMALQSTFVGVVVTAWLGDASAAIAGVSTALLETRYSREFEREADAFAASMLKHNHLSPGLLASILQKLGAQHGKAEEGGRVPELLSSHPPTRERIEALQAAAR